jgi:hypothetical protein
MRDCIVAYSIKSNKENISFFFDSILRQCSLDRSLAVCSSQPTNMMVVLRVIFALLITLIPLQATRLTPSSPSTAVVDGSKSMRGNLSFISPNLYFVGFSKCGTTSMIRLLVDHPLVVDVGDESYNPGSESHIFDHFPHNKFNSIQSERLRQRLKTKPLAKEIIDHGVIVHYTPNYAGLKNIEDDIIKSLKENKKTTKSAKFLFMLRNPTSRTASSWWYKNHCYKRKDNSCPSFKPQIDQGIAAVHNLQSCYAKHNFTLERLVNGLRDGQRDLTKPEQHVLDLCPITLMAPPNTSLYGAHVGKSIYVYQLAHWFNRISSSQIYLMFLENYVENPVREVEMFFEWLGVETYGSSGYHNPKSLHNLTQRQFNVHPIPPEIQKKEVNPYRKHLDEFYRPYVKALQTLLRPLSSRHKTAPSGNWSELVHEVLEHRLLTRKQQPVEQSLEKTQR